jgi:hypothetical protein
MPNPGQMIGVTANYELPRLVGMRFSSDNPFEFTFILSGGNIDRNEQAIKAELAKIHKYFLAALTIPEQDLWVNLSPYEQNRIAPDILSQTELGKDLLGEDYVLKQLAASLTYPESETGKKYWAAANNYTTPYGGRSATNSRGALDAGVRSSFTKVWIIPGKIKILEAKDRMAIDQATLKVMTDEDYLAMNKNNVGATPRGRPDNNGQAQGPAPTESFKKYILPSIEQEVNQGKNFSQFRQIYSALIMAGWFKNKLKNTILNESYLNKSKIKGADTADKAIREKIYNEYVKAFQQGVYNYVKRVPYGDNLATTSRGALRAGVRSSRIAYFSGGVPANLAVAAGAKAAVAATPEAVHSALVRQGANIEEMVTANPAGSQSAAALFPEQVQELLAQAKAASDEVIRLSRELSDIRSVYLDQAGHFASEPSSERSVALLERAKGDVADVRLRIAAADERMVMARATLALGYKPTGDFRKHILAAHRDIIKQLTLDLNMQRPDGTFPKAARVLNEVPYKYLGVMQSFTDGYVYDKIKMAMTGMLNIKLTPEQEAIGKRLALYGALGSSAAGSSAAIPETDALRAAAWATAQEIVDKFFTENIPPSNLPEITDTVAGLLSKVQRYSEGKSLASFDQRSFDRLLNSYDGGGTMNFLRDCLGFNPNRHEAYGILFQNRKLLESNIRAVEIFGYPKSQLGYSEEEIKAGEFWLDYKGQSDQAAREKSIAAFFDPKNAQIQAALASGKMLRQGAMSITGEDAYLRLVYLAYVKASYRMAVMLKGLGIAFNPKKSLYSQLKKFGRVGFDDFAAIMDNAFEEAIVHSRLAAALGREPNQKEFMAVWFRHLANIGKKGRLIAPPDPQDNFSRRKSTLSREDIMKGIEILTCGGELGFNERSHYVNEEWRIVDKHGYVKALEAAKVHYLFLHPGTTTFSYAEAKLIYKKGAAGSTTKRRDEAAILRNAIESVVDETMLLYFDRFPEPQCSRIKACLEKYLPTAVKTFDRHGNDIVFERLTRNYAETIRGILYDRWSTVNGDIYEILRGAVTDVYHYVAQEESRSNNASQPYTQSDVVKIFGKPALRIGLSSTELKAARQWLAYRAQKGKQRLDMAVQILTSVQDSSDPEVEALLVLVDKYAKQLKKEKSFYAHVNHGEIIDSVPLDVLDGIADLAFEKAICESRLARALGVAEPSSEDFYFVWQMHVYYKERGKEKWVLKAPPDAEGWFDSTKSSYPSEIIKEMRAELAGKFGPETATKILGYGAAGSGSISEVTADSDRETRAKAAVAKAKQDFLDAIKGNTNYQMGLNSSEQEQLAAALVVFVQENNAFYYDIVSDFVTHWLSANVNGIDVKSGVVQNDIHYLSFALWPRNAIVRTRLGKIKDELADAGVGGFAMQNVGKQEVDTTQGAVKFSADKALTQWKNILGVELKTVSLKF